MAAYAMGAATCGGHGDRGTMLVSTDWLGQHLTDKNLVILAIGQPADYKEHLPGASSLTLDQVSTPMEMGKLILERPPIDQLHETLSKVGITNDSRIVLYLSNNGVQSMTRVYLTLDAVGLGPRTSILDGGMKSWKSEKRPVTTEVGAVKPGNLELCMQNDVMATTNYVKPTIRHPEPSLLDTPPDHLYT